jgi:hypothetical protein
MPNKPHTGKFIKCLSCKTDFYIPINRFTTAKYCSRSCKDKCCAFKIKDTCKICGNEFEHISARCNKAKYCSRKCYHKSQIGKGLTQYICRHCGITFNDSASCKRIYCSKACVNKSTKDKWHPVYSTVRKKMLSLGLIEKCTICGYDEFKDILGVHHQDGNRNNNTKENLIVVCPMCHSLIHHKHICH